MILPLHGNLEIQTNYKNLTQFVSLIYISIFLDEKILISSVVGLTIIVVGVLSQYIKLNKESL
jgi:hypothetical protein